MLEAEADLWTYSAAYRCITTNGVLRNGTGELVMGAGIALDAKNRFPTLPSKLGRWVQQYGNRPFLCKEEGLITFPTKHHWRDKSDIWLIRQSAKQIVEIADKFSIQSVALTRPGCGNGGLTWGFVKSYIEDVFDNRFTVVNYVRQFS